MTLSSSWKVTAYIFVWDQLSYNFIWFSCLFKYTILIYELAFSFSSGENHSVMLLVVNTYQFTYYAEYINFVILDFI